MTAEEILSVIKAHYPGVDLKIDEYNSQAILIPLESLFEICRFLKESPELAFDFLVFASAMDNQEQIQAIYALASYTHKHLIFIKANLPKDNPQIESLCLIWPAADWHERETYDLFGIKYLNHPNLQRLMMPADWEGFPLRKDYKHSNLISKPQSF
jgi:NADH-quinone oxidoreductase subunit C